MSDSARFQPAATEANREAEVSRRDLLRNLLGAIAAGAGVPWRAGSAAPSPSGVKTPVPTVPALGTDQRRFFTAGEKEMISTIADLIVPNDEVSPGARVAGVPEWIDFVVANSPRAVQQNWREGLAVVDRVSVESLGHKFLDLDPAAQQRLLEQWAEREESPKTPAEHFFVLAKEATVNGYYTSEIGLGKDLGYRGGTAMAEPDTSCPAKKAASGDEGRGSSGSGRP